MYDHETEELIQETDEKVYDLPPGTVCLKRADFEKIVANARQHRAAWESAQESAVIIKRVVDKWLSTLQSVGSEEKGLMVVIQRLADEILGCDNPL